MGRGISGAHVGRGEVTHAYTAIKAHLADITPREAMELLGMLLEPAVGDPDPLYDAEVVSEAMAPVMHRYRAEWHNIQAALAEWEAGE